MKIWIPILILLLSVTGLCVWDTINTTTVFNKMTVESSIIYDYAQNNEIENIKQPVKDLNNYWTKKMDILSISISRKDLQPISDYLQHLQSAIDNDSIEDAITYSRLLKYNIEGLKESSGITFLNLL